MREIAGSARRGKDARVEASGRVGRQDGLLGHVAELYLRWRLVPLRGFESTKGLMKGGHLADSPLPLPNWQNARS